MLFDSFSHRGKVSAGVLMYRTTGPDGDLQVYIVHSGGPYFQAHRDRFWGIPKGLTDGPEPVQDAAIREFREETGFEPPDGLVDLGETTGRHGKVIRCFAARWTESSDPPEVNSNTCMVEWPPNSGTEIEIPEVDEGRFVGMAQARKMMGHAQRVFLDRLRDYLGYPPDSVS
jgi:predicted NUDIX family NTP pyrophosphohydrolase